MAKEQAMSFIEMFQKKAEETPEKQSFKIHSFNTKEGEKKKIRFISDFNEPITMFMHGKYNPSIGKKGGMDYNFPCLRQLGKECPMCKEYEEQDDFDLKAKENYIWTVKEYEYDKKLYFMMNASPKAKTIIPYLIDILTDEDEEVEDLRKHDLSIKQIGAGTNKSFTIKAGKEEEMLNEKPYTKKEIIELMKQETGGFKFPNGYPSLEEILSDNSNDLDSKDDEDLPF